MATTHHVFTYHRVDNVVYADGSHTNHWLIPVVSGDLNPVFTVTAFNRANTPIVCVLSKCKQTVVNDYHDIRYSLTDPYSSGSFEFKLQAIIRRNDGSWRLVRSTLPPINDDDADVTDDDVSDEE